MALIHCPECNCEISNKTNICPHCGFPLFDGNNEEKKKSLIGQVITYIFMGLIAILLGIVILLIIKLEKKIDLVEMNKTEETTKSEIENDTSTLLETSVTENLTTAESVEEKSEYNISDPYSPMYGYEKVSKFYWASDDNNIFVQTDDIYITKDSEGNYGVVAKLLIAGASEEKGLKPRIELFLCQDGKRYEGVTHSGSLKNNMTDIDAFMNYYSNDEYLYPPNDGFGGSISEFPVAHFMSIASYDLEDTFQVCVRIVPRELGDAYSDDQVIKQYMEVDHLEVR